MAKKNQNKNSITAYEVLAGLDTSDEKRFEAGDVITADDLHETDLAAYLEMGVIRSNEPEQD